jgi:hypothetical protein
MVLWYSLQGRVRWFYGRVFKEELRWFYGRVFEEVLKWTC